MAAQDIATALERTQSVLRRRPSVGLHDDAPALARWDGGVRTVASHADGYQIATDLPVELGGAGDQVSPGWLMRAGLASCTATCIVMVAAAAGLELDALEVRASSRSDIRALLGPDEADGSNVYPGPRDLQMVVRISARGVSPARLRALVEEARRVTPTLAAIQDACPVDIRVVVETA